MHVVDSTWTCTSKVGKRNKTAHRDCAACMRHACRCIACMLAISSTALVTTYYPNASVYEVRSTPRTRVYTHSLYGVVGVPTVERISRSSPDLWALLSSQIAFSLVRSSVPDPCCHRPCPHASCLSRTQRRGQRRLNGASSRACVQ